MHDVVWVYLVNSTDDSNFVITQFFYIIVHCYHFYASENTNYETAKNPEIMKHTHIRCTMHMDILTSKFVKNCQCEKLGIANTGTY